jgi:S-DNA-T family DNA segregation ATPase FtsK/SpoIIIE
LAILIFPAMVLLQIGLPERDFLPRGGGGIIGYLLDLVLEHLIHRVGTVIVAVAAALVGVSLLFRVHLKSFFAVPWGWVSGLAAALGKRKAVTVGSEDPTRPVNGAEKRRKGKGRPKEADTGGPECAAGDASGGDKVRDATRVQKPAPEVALPLFRGADRQKAGRGRGEPTPIVRPPEPDEDATRVGKRTDDRPAPAPVPGEVAAPAPAVQPETGSVPVIVDERPVSEVTGSEVPPPVVEETDGKQGNVPVAPIFKPARREWEVPDVGLLDTHSQVRQEIDEKSLQDSARLLVEKLKDFKVDGEVVGIHPGPVITMFEFRPGRGIKVAQVASLSKDLAMALAAEQVRVIAPIPGRDVVGIEIPNKIREMVYLRDLITNKKYKDGKHKLPLVLGKDIAGFPVVSDLTKAPHLLMAGTTGSGKSVALHAFILSLLYRMTPDQVRFILVDTKMLELTSYAEIPHLLVPVVTEARDAAVALRWAVGEMERRNRLMSSVGVPNITEYNQLVKSRQEIPGFKATIKKVTRGPEGVKEETIGQPEEARELPYIVVVIDELADLMMVAGKQVETTISRLAQMARAAGIHMVIATQNPTIKVVTGIIKANMPARMSFKVRTMQDSRVILDQNGADDLLGYGDMLSLPPGDSKLQRIHGAFVSTEERKKVVEFLRAQGAPEYNFEIMEAAAAAAAEGGDGEFEDSTAERDDLYEKAVQLAISWGKVSTSQLQRELGVGYNKAANLMTRMEREGLVGPPEAAGKPRVVLATRR